MRIAIIGTGNIGGNLGKVWAAKGHEIVFGARNPESDKTKAALAAIGDKAKVAGISEAVATAELVVLATPWTAVEETLQQTGDLTGKILVDTTNRIAPDDKTFTHSTTEEIARLAPTAKVIKTFNSVGAEYLLQPKHSNGQTATMFLCGDDADAKAIVEKLGQEIGLDMVDAGPLSASNHLEALAKFWVYLAFGQKLGRGIAFQLLK